jgi:hypothetical protein
MKIYLDTNAISKVGHDFSRSLYLKVEKLCADHGYSVVMHEVAKREVETQITEKLIGDISNAAVAARRIYNKATSSVIKSKLLEITDYFNVNRDVLIFDKLKPFHNWLKRCNAEILSISATDAEAVFSDYFEGRGAFSSIKNRKDLPDGFILQGLRSLEGESDEIILICDDGNLARAVRQSCFKNVFKHLDDFFKSNIIEGVDFDFSIDHLRIAYGDLVFKRVVASTSFKQLIEKCLEDHDWDEVVLEEDSESEPNIVGIGGIFDLKIELIEAVENEIRVKCNCDVDVDMEYYVHKSDAMCIPDEDIAGIHFTDWNKHVFLASTNTTLPFEIECIVSLDENFSFTPGEPFDDIITKILDSSSCVVESVRVSNSNND